MWKLGVAGLAPAESGLVRALLSLAADGDPQPAWSYAGNDHCDLLLVDATREQPEAAAARQGARMIVLVGPQGGPQAGLSRPLERTAFEACLRRAARQLQAQPAAAAAPMATTAASAAVPSVAPVAPTAPATRCAGAERAELRRRYKLRRWPPTELLRGEAHRVRMASQLSRRYLSACELAQLTQLDPERSHTFLQLLQGFRLLETEPALAVASAPPRRPGPPPSRRLIDSIRRRLGL